MRDIGLAVSLMRAAVAAVRIPVTLKMRLGWDSQSLNAPQLGRLAEAEGIAMLTVHGRTRCQFYAAKADWTAIGEVKKAVSIPVVANGDCASLADAVAILAQSGADAVMIGRSAIGRPWFVGDVAYYLAHGKARPKRRRPSAKARRSNITKHCLNCSVLAGLAPCAQASRRLCRAGGRRGWRCPAPASGQA